MRKVACGEANASFIGDVVRIDGWVNRRRDHGGLIFIDVRDRSGVTQVLFSPELSETFAAAEALRGEDVVRVNGTVRRRPEGTENPKLATGEIEIVVERLEVLNTSQTPPFVVAGDEHVDESVRLKYRYLDLRRARMQRNLTVRHRIVKAMRDYFDEHGFLEIETPNLIKSTPEGARDYLVPSRVHQGSFYALPQSPQLLKQILMIGGLGRYMQIARCFRDEDPRADRQPEFSQLDVEMSFVEQEEVMAMMEGCVRHVWRHALDTAIPDPLPRMSHAEAMRRYGSDKPDLRFGLELVDVLELFAKSEFALFRSLAEKPGNRVVALRYPGGASLSRRDFDALTETAKGFGAKGLAYLTFSADGVKGSIAKFTDDALATRLRELTEAKDGDALLFVGDASAAASDTAGRLRVHVGERLGLLDPAAFSFCWVIDFPLFERDPDSGEITFAHHPFTSPLPGQEALLDVDPMAMRARHYDLVLNGYELGSGSIRNHAAEYQRKIFRKLGMTEEEIDDRFGFFLEALSYGAPPHGGMALGLDRIAMLACGESSIRDVIAFPKNQMARDMMMDSPSSVAPKQLRELGIELKVPAGV